MRANHSYTLPNERRFDALRAEAAHYLQSLGFVLGDHRDARLRIAVVAGETNSEHYVIERRRERDGTTLTIRANGTRGAGHGLHHALRLLGFGFSFFADATPQRPVLRWPVAGNVLRVQPAFATRGLLPWGNLLNSINVWNFEDYARCLRTLWRWGGNFVLFHNYDHEPLAAFRDARGKWSHGKPYPNSFHPPCSGVPGIRVEEFPHGTARLFRDARRGVWGARHSFARNPIAAAQAEFRRVIAFARSIGLDAGFGFELSGDPSTPGNRQQLARRIRHVLEAYPDLHTLCLWESESLGLWGWPTFAASPGYRQLHRRYARHFRDLDHVPNRLAEGVRLATLFRWAYDIAREIRPSIQIAFSGWGGDRWLRWGDYWRGLHECLPDDVVLAQLDNILPRWQPGVSQAIRPLARQRTAWTTLWIESDGGPVGHSSMWHPQEDLGHLEKLVKSAARLGYSGLLAQNWNTAGVELSAAFVAAGAWTPTLTARAFRREYAGAFFSSRRVARLLEELEALGPGWTGTSQHAEWDAFTWESFPAVTTGKITPVLDRLGRLLARARQDCFQVEQLDRAAMFRLDGLLMQFGTQSGRRDAFERLQRLRSQFARLGLRRPHARRLLATMDFVIAYEQIKRQLGSRGRLAAQQALLRQVRAAGLRPDPRLVASYRQGLVEVERLWKAVFKAQAARLDTRSDLGTLATINVKAYPKWKEFVNAITA